MGGPSRSVLSDRPERRVAPAGRASASEPSGDGVWGRSHHSSTSDPEGQKRLNQVWAALGAVDDPEYPGVSIVDLGLVEHVRVDGAVVEVDLVPTFSGCPALSFIAEDVRTTVGALDGVADVAVTFVSSPAWTPERIAPAARRRIAENFGVGVQLGTKPVACPQCGAAALREQSLFGPVRCRSVHRCASCGEVVELIR